MRFLVTLRISKQESEASTMATTTTMATTQQKKKTPTDVFFYIPNLIGYVRVGLTAFSLAIALKDYKTSVVCYALSFVCDYFDGFFARWFDQCSNFGAVLDMVTDRYVNACLCMAASR